LKIKEDYGKPKGLAVKLTVKIVEVEAIFTLRLWLRVGLDPYASST